MRQVFNIPLVLLALCSQKWPPCFCWGFVSSPVLTANNKQRPHQNYAFAVPQSSSSSSSRLLSSTKPVEGQIVTIDCTLEPEGDFVPEPLFDTRGELTFVLHRGNYLPGLHDLVATLEIGERVENVSLDAGWGSRNPNLVATIELERLESSMLDVSLLKIGTQLAMSNGMTAVVTDLTSDTVTIDANPSLAGASYLATVELRRVQDGPDEFEYSPNNANADNKSPYQVATFALGCFWGCELDFMRQVGVVGTMVGYTQGNVDHPTYQQVCTGTTNHTEAVQVIFDASVISYRRLAELAMDRLGEYKYMRNQVGNDIGTQYRHGLYYHNDAQRQVAEGLLAHYGEDCVTECLPATKFWPAEDYHQQYLLKGGQSARKGDSSVIRCYG